MFATCCSISRADSLNLRLKPAVHVFIGKQATTAIGTSLFRRTEFVHLQPNSDAPSADPMTSSS